jgi:hypothetical protein
MKFATELCIWAFSIALWKRNMLAINARMRSIEERLGGALV